MIKFILTRNIIIKKTIMNESYLTFGQQKKYKYILVGDSNVGKTALFWRFVQGSFAQGKNTLVTTVDFKMKNVSVNGTNAKLYIWDTAGQEKYRSIVSTYFKGCHGIFLVFDLGIPQSFEHASQQWYQICKVKADGAIVYLVGTKADLNQQISDQVILKCSRQKKIKYMKTSSKTGQNVEELFLSMTKSIMDKQSMPEKSQSFSLSRETLKTPKQKKNCC